MNDDHQLLLVVDDNEINRRMLSRRLQHEGYTVVTAEDGRLALETLELQDFDLVLLDIMMPVMDGYEVLQTMKSSDRFRHVPVIMVTALDEIESAVKCIQMGAEDYLTKPFNPVILKARVQACLKKKAWHDQEQSYLHAIEAEKSRADDLLRVIFPQNVIDELKATNGVKPRRHEEVAVLICDIVGFTPYCERHEPEEVVQNLSELTEAFEDLSSRHGLEKINSIGDQFMAACGLDQTYDNPVLNCVKCGLEMTALTESLSAGWKVRIGVHVGPVISGVVGKKKFLYGLWGDTVNTTARAQSYGVEGCVNLSRDAWVHIADLCSGESRGLISVKGKGDLELFRVEKVLQ